MNSLPSNILSFLLILLLSLATPLFAKGLSTEEANKFLNESGLNELISSLPSSMGQQLDMSRLSKNSPADLEQVTRAVTNAANKVDGQKIALVYLSRENRAEELSEALKFLSSPLGQRISAEERNASTPEAQLKMQEYAKEQMSKPANQARAKLLQDLSDALNADQVVINLMKGVYFSVLDTVELINASRAKSLRNQMEQEWQSMEPMLQQQFSSFMLMGANYSYRNLSDVDLNNYIGFLKSKSGQAYWQVGVDIIDLYIQGFVSELVAELSNGD